MVAIQRVNGSAYGNVDFYSMKNFCRKYYTHLSWALLDVTEDVHAFFSYRKRMFDIYDNCDWKKFEDQLNESQFARF